MQTAGELETLYGINYGEQDKLCLLCSKHIDSQKARFDKCEKLR